MKVKDRQIFCIRCSQKVKKHSPLQGKGGNFSMWLHLEPSEENGRIFEMICLLLEPSQENGRIFKMISLLQELIPSQERWSFLLAESFLSGSFLFLDFIRFSSFFRDNRGTGIQKWFIQVGDPFILIFILSWPKNMKWASLFLVRLRSTLVLVPREDGADFHPLLITHWVFNLETWFWS